MISSSEQGSKSEIIEGVREVAKRRKKKKGEK